MRSPIYSLCLGASLDLPNSALPILGVPQVWIRGCDFASGVRNDVEATNAAIPQGSKPATAFGTDKSPTTSAASTVGL